MKYYTHGGRLHADEVLGYVITEMAGICDSFERLTNFENLPTDGLIADIGRAWEPEQLRFDHHQGFFTRENGMPYAAAGMLWKEYGRRICGDQGLADRIDEKFIQGVDADDADNAYSVKGICSGGEFRVLTFPNLIKSYNTADVKDAVEQGAAFQEAATLARRTLIHEIAAAKKFLAGVEKFESIVEVEGTLLILSEYVAWQEVVEKKYPDALYIITPSSHPENPVSLTAVPVKAGSRELKQPIERPDWFDKFIHQGKWIAGCDSLEQAKKLAAYQSTVK